MANTQVYIGEAWTFTHNGQSFKAKIEQDTDLGAPWEEHDGHCPVQRVAHNYGSQWGDSKKPGELVFHRGDRREYSYMVDMPECIALALADGWGAPDSDVARFVAKHGRQPTKRETAVLAVLADIEFLRGWCADDWHWVGVMVCPIGEDGEPVGQDESVWGIDSLSGDYIRDDVAHELADQCTIDESMLALGTDE
jgi:hypothetical protein